MRRNTLTQIMWPICDSESRGGSRWVLQLHHLIEPIENTCLKWYSSAGEIYVCYMQTQAMFEGAESTNDCRVMYDTKHTVRDLRNSIGFVLRDAEGRVFDGDC